MAQETKRGGGEIKIIPINAAKSAAELAKETPIIKRSLDALQDMQDDSRSWSTGQIQIPSTLIGR